MLQYSIYDMLQYSNGLRTQVRRGTHIKDYYFYFFRIRRRTARLCILCMYRRREVYKQETTNCLSLSNFFFLRGATQHFNALHHPSNDCNFFIYPTQVLACQIKIVSRLDILSVKQFRLHLCTADLPKLAYQSHAFRAGIESAPLVST